jgi:RimJ/RimL family protein N-acetyltransferase
VTVRRARRTDAAALARFNIAMAWETEKRRLAPATVRRGVQRLLAQPRYGFYLVATRAGAPVGCLLITYEWTDWRDGLFWWLQSVYVTPSARRAGVYRALHAAVVRRAQLDPRVRGLRLYVEQENRRAQRVYRAVGMHPTRYRVFET